MFGFVEDVAGEFAEAEWKFAVEVEEGSCDEGDSADNQQGAAEFAGWVHQKKCRRVSLVRQRVTGCFGSIPIE